MSTILGRDWCWVVDGMRSRWIPWNATPGEIDEAWTEFCSTLGWKPATSEIRYEW